MNIYYKLTFHQKKESVNEHIFIININKCARIYSVNEHLLRI